MAQPGAYVTVESNQPQGLLQEQRSTRRGEILFCWWDLSNLKLFSAHFWASV